MHSDIDIDSKRLLHFLSRPMSALRPVQTPWPLEWIPNCRGKLHKFIALLLFRLLACGRSEWHCKLSPSSTLQAGLNFRHACEPKTKRILYKAIRRRQKQELRSKAPMQMVLFQLSCSSKPWPGDFWRHLIMWSPNSCIQMVEDIQDVRLW